MVASNSRQVVIHLPVEIGIPITIVREGGCVWVIGAQAVVAEFPVVVGKEETNGIAFANDNIDLKKSNGKVVVGLLRSSSESITVAVDGGGDSMFRTMLDKPRLNITPVKPRFRKKRAIGGNLRVEAQGPLVPGKKMKVSHLNDISVKVDQNPKEAG